MSLVTGAVLIGVVGYLTWLLLFGNGYLVHGTEDWREGFLFGIGWTVLAQWLIAWGRGFFGAALRDLRKHDHSKMDSR